MTGSYFVRYIMDVKSHPGKYSLGKTLRFAHGKYGFDHTSAHSSEIARAFDKLRFGHTVYNVVKTIFESDEKFIFFSPVLICGNAIEIFMFFQIVHHIFTTAGGCCKSASIIAT